MVIDQIHDLQQVYRKVVHSMSRPGSISNLNNITEKLEDDLPCNHAFFLCALTVLDAEVTFHVVASEEKKARLIEILSSYNMSRIAPVDEADFILLLQDAPEYQMNQALLECKTGNLHDPQQSATWIIESGLLSNISALSLSGPGINGTQQLQTGIQQDFWQRRNDKVKEYPLGIDLVFADFSSQIACIPRTTAVTITEVV
ncbi:alpha-D-ribose 1-methylphosphonate 5-triphosphate synthase subunit PhnH [Gracilibacillus orientalis]|uniref:Alpha-D-ribose 1-methylphosphonate 5-triphosphate synthase subunit PhnH n=1 Tax=Gracilibacillus orientalis TaxID=334253 RepID=A0A1I4JWV9_9BACI|nr:phosphonate C-P lyase system protein PhnH [Gracilibacillus orientalis]SFL70954.1 alpha-D-ribose 1-methylphosphonate 5-triphosphate synthase subunit PhnH [Gracilibacillus orientalis]